MVLVKRNIVIACCILIACVVMYLVYLFNPAEFLFYPPCILKKLTGLDCPGCGGTRALHSLLHGKIAEAANYNLLFLVLLPLLFISLLERFIFKSVRVWSIINKPIFFVVIVCIFWILRNIDQYPFSYLHSSK